MGAPALPKRNDLVEYRLFNTGLLPEQYDSLFSVAIKEYRIIYSGDFKNLDFLIQQLSTCRNKSIKLLLDNVDVDYNIVLPLTLLGPNVDFVFHNDVEYQSNFYNYLVNLDYLDVNNIPMNDFYKKLLTDERRIQGEFLREFEDVLLKRGKTVDDYSKTQLMDFVFNYVCSNFPYDVSITRSDGSGDTRTFQLGGTAAATYTRGKGVCEGRSKLIKLFANNRILQVPCYLATGNHGNLPHVWNEYINESGQIIEYDSSFGTKVVLSRLPRIYKLVNHEQEVRRLLK